MIRENAGKGAAAPGGASTINGVLYQLLWSLLRASSAKFVTKPQVRDHEICEAVLILEPVGGGGDLVFQSGGRRYVEQVKARARAKAWSLKEIVETVIPDLYLAAEGDLSTTEFRFVTEGRMGRWADEYDFFRSFRSRPVIDGCPLADLESERPLVRPRKARTRPSDPGRPPDTERSLFLQIVAEVRKRKAVKGREPEAETQRRLRFLLGRFEFVGERLMSRVRDEIDAHLLAVVDRIDDLPQIRDSLALDLARLATVGDAEVNCVEFFAAHNLDATPLTDWGTFRDAAHRLFDATVQRLGYEASRDVRVEAGRLDVESWQATTPLLVVTGESGSGKTWRSYAIGACERSGRALPVLVTAGASVDVTLDRAAATVWQEIGGHDATIPLSQIARRLRRVVGENVFPWLTLIIDGTLDARQAEELARKPWDDWGVRVVLTAAPHIAEAVERISRGRSSVVTVSEFSAQELHAYLDWVLGDEWPLMPGFVRTVLRRPLFADLYRQIVESDDARRWSPRSEYELFAAFWQRASVDSPLDESLLIALAKRCLMNAEATWSAHDLHVCGAGDEAIARLERNGWLRRTRTDDRQSFAFAHGRLLNWACACSLREQWRRGDIANNTLFELLRSLLDGTTSNYGSRLAFVPMDFLWLVCQDEPLRVRAGEVLAGLEGHHRRNDGLYRDLVPSLGVEIIGPLAARLRNSTADPYTARMIARAIGTIGGERAADMGLGMLTDADPLVRRFACEIFEVCPDDRALNPLWSLHNESQTEPSRFSVEFETSARPFLYERTFAALKECCRLNHGWLVEAIHEAESSRVAVHDLAYLVASVGGDAGRRLWAETKASLFAKVPESKLRSLATCIDVYADRDEIPWLIEAIGESRDFTSPKAFAALARLDAARAVGELPRLTKRELVWTRAWFRDYLFAVVPDETRTTLREMVIGGNDPWDAAGIYVGRSHRLDRRTLEVLLESTKAQLIEVLSIPDWGDREPSSLYGPLQFLAHVDTPALVCQLQEWRGTELESGLVGLIARIGPRTGLYRDSLVRSEAFGLLFRIDGKGFAIAVNLLLRAPTRFGRQDGLDLARKRVNPETLRLLAEICTQDETWDGAHFEQCRAAEILAEHEVWEPVIRLVRKIGLSTFDGVTGLPEEGFRPQPALLADITASVVAKPGEATPGDIIALGFGAAGQAEAVRLVAANRELPTDVARACAVALRMLEDHDERNVPFLRERLSEAQNRFAAANALIMNGTPASLEALAADLGGELAVAEVINVVNRLADPRDAVEKTRAKIARLIESQSAWDLAGKLWTIVRHVSNHEFAGRILDHRAIDDWLREEAFADEGGSWFTGSKAAAVQCLGRSDRRAAFVAAKSALRNVNAHDRDFYPPIMAELDPTMAAAEFLSLLSTERSEPVKRSIGWTLGALELESVLIDRMTAADPEQRRSACFAAGWAKVSERIEAGLRSCLADSIEPVAAEAATALDRIVRRGEARKLVLAIRDATTVNERWLFLECLLSFADPGDHHHPWPEGDVTIGDLLTPLQLDYASERLKARRKDNP